ncbi:HXXXD-type acyl-transferase family protein [Actinidia rufa]|uniref:HXXXD-type acyl-transferase family protein n=1 Tax=Actinidia rufa TaxID=165716 RepID=A0A7J0FT63_9ERIC|nr:HXXXD-type acyl-transferase family protein [Actinidia rufa]
MASVKILSKAHVKPKKPIGRREVKKLEEGLGVVLEEFYQLAGKLGKDEEGVFRVEYDDDMDGVEVAVAAAEEIGIADLIMEEGTENVEGVGALQWSLEF